MYIESSKQSIFDKNNILFILLCIPALVWIIYRIIYVDITHDEAWSFHMAYKFKYRNMAGTANNHWLNTIFLFFESKLLGTQVWKLRLHSVIAFLIFSYYLIKILIRIPNKWIAYSVLVLIIYNSYILDFFSLARGYGLGLAFQMMALYFIFSKSKEYKNRLLIYFALCLSAFSVYTHLYFLLAYGAFELILFFSKKEFSKEQIIEFIKPLWLPALFFIFATANILFIKKTGDLNEGLSNGFLQDSLGVFFQRAYEPLLTNTIAVLIGAILILSVLIAALLPKRFLTANNSKQLAFLLLLAVVIHQLFFYLFNIPFPYGRTALYIVAPFLLCFGLLLGEVKLLNHSKIFGTILFLFFLFFLFGQIGYIYQYKNIHTTQEWWYGQDVSKALKKISSSENRNLKDLTFLCYEGHSGIFRNYYELLNGEKIFKRTDRIQSANNDDTGNNESIIKKLNNYDYILLPDYDKTIRQNINWKLYDSLVYYDNMKTWLLQKKEPNPAI